MNAQAAEAAREHLHHVHLADAETWAPAAGHEGFDAIVCGDVLEHMREPLAFLRRARDWLKDDGVLIASIPNVRHHTVLRGLLDGNWTYEPAGLLDRDHVRFFTRREIEKLFDRAGFALAELRLVPGWGYDEWRGRGSPGEVKAGRLHIGGMPPAEAEEFYVYQYLGFAWDWAKANRGTLAETDRLVGFCLLIRRELIDTIGLLDERFGIGCFEDDDYCRRALAAGFRAVIVRDEEAIGFLRHSIRNSGHGESHVRKAYALLVHSLQQLGCMEEAWESCRTGLARFADDPELLLRRAALLHAVGRRAEAISAYHDVLNARPARHFSSIVCGLQGHLTRDKLAILYEDCGELRKAEEQWRLVCREAPRYAPG